MKTKAIVVTNIIHIGKESNKLDEDFGLDSDSYVIYENKEEIDRKFREILPLILELKPKDVKKFGISRQTLWNIKEKIQKEKISNISQKIKNKLIFSICRN